MPVADHDEQPKDQARSLSELEAELANARREAALAKTHGAEEVARVSADLEVVRRQLDRLSQRRSVRVVLRLASVFRPWIVIKRRLGRLRTSKSVAQSRPDGSPPDVSRPIRIHLGTPNCAPLPLDPLPALTVYCASTARHVGLPGVDSQQTGVTYVCFTDAEVVDAPGWQVRPIEYFNTEPTLTIGFLKTHPHVVLSDTAWSAWLDDGVEVSVPALRGLVCEMIEQGQVWATEEEGGSDRPAASGCLVRKHHHPLVRGLDVKWWAAMDADSTSDRSALEAALRASDLTVEALNRATETEKSVGADRRRPASSPAGVRQVDVVVPVHNSLPDVQMCLESVKATATGEERLIIVDDGSDDPTASWCARFAATSPNVELIRREVASGFTKAANAGMREAGADLVVILNSDVVVSPRWLSKLAAVASSAPDLGLVGPLSNAATGQSIPFTHDAKGRLAINPLPGGFTPQELDIFCEERGKALPLARVTLLNGFCMMITRAVIDELGHFDEAAFPQGYGEEVDYCFRATDAGFGLAVAVNTFVYHAKSRSYGRDRARELRRAGSEIVTERWGEVRLRRARESARLHPVLMEMRRAAEPLWKYDAGPTAAC